MSADAIVMMVVAMLVLWGGLAAAVVNLGRNDAGQAAGTGGADAWEAPPHRDA